MQGIVKAKIVCRADAPASLLFILAAIMMDSVRLGGTDGIFVESAKA
jgi:hypothetical protein